MWATVLGAPAAPGGARDHLSAQGHRLDTCPSAAQGERCPVGVEGARWGIMVPDRDLGRERIDDPLYVLYDGCE